MYAENNGVKIWYEIHGGGEPTLVMVPGFQIVHSDAFKRSYIPYFSRHMRIISFDLRGSGKSDKTEEGHDLDTYTTDLHAVISDAGLTRFAVAGLSLGTLIAIRYYVRHPRCVSHLILLSGSAKTVRSEDYPPGVPEDLLQSLLQIWQTQPEDMLKGFIDLACSEKHSLRSKEMTWKWAHETTSKIWAMGFSVSSFSDVTEELKEIDIPALIIHGQRDKIILPKASEYLHRNVRNSKFMLIPEAGHGFVNTWPQVASHIFDFLKPENVSLLTKEKPEDTKIKILWISSPIGLGHVKRDLAIVQEMRKKMPKLIVEWLAADPVRSFLENIGEHVHPLSDDLWDENAHMESYSNAYSLNPTEAYWEMDDLLANNFMVFADATRQGAYDLVVGDEAWEVFKFLHYNPSMKTAPFVFITDFIGTTNVSDDEIKKTHVQDINGSWVEMHEIHPEASDLSIFLGDIEDVPDIQFGEGLPSRRTWAREHFKFPGYVFSFDAACYSDKHALRRELGFLPEEKILLIAVGGTSVGRPLIDKYLEIHADLKVRVPGIRTVVLSGPRIDPKSFGEMEGVDFLPFIQDPIKLFAACDLAVIQGGLSTALELAALNRPFLYFPLKDHFEQQDLVDLRLKRLRAGIRMDFDSTGPSQFVEAISTNISKPADYKTISQDGAKRVADMILALLPEKGEV